MKTVYRLMLATDCVRAGCEPLAPCDSVDIYQGKVEYYQRALKDEARLVHSLVDPVGKLATTWIRY